MKLAPLVLVAILTPLCCAAQIVNPRPVTNPVKPSPRSPDGLTKAWPRTAVLKWRQPLLGSPLGNEAAASYFHLCIYAPAVESCASTTHQAMPGANVLARTPVTTPTNSSVVIAYDYSYSFVLPWEYFNKQLVWRVGACGSAQTSSCTYAETPTWLSTYDMKAHSVVGGRAGDWGPSIGGNVQNAGTVDGSWSSANLRVWNARSTGAGACITDVNDPSVDAGMDSVLLANGDIVAVSALPTDGNGNRDVGARSPVAILVGPPIADQTTSDDHTAGPIETVVIARWLTAPSFPAGFGAKLVVDSDRQLREFNETNNALGACVTIGP